MSEAIFKTSEIYQSICSASAFGRQRGMSVKELKKEFGMKNRDILSLLSFLDKLDISEDQMIRYDIYRLTDHYGKERESLIFDELDEEDIEYIDLSENNLGNDVYIRIEDYIETLNRQIEGLDITNASVIQKLGKYARDSWNRISSEKMNMEYVLIKGQQEPGSEQSIKAGWIQAMLRGQKVQIQMELAGIHKNIYVFPAGLYYNRFLDEYKCVYVDEKVVKKGGKLEYYEWSLKDIVRLMLVEDADRLYNDLDLEKYLKSIQREKMVLKVFREGRVGEKLKFLLSENQLKIQTGADADLFTFWTDDPWQYLKIIMGYGKSVVVLEPEDIREEILNRTEEALRYYEEGRI